MDNSAHRFCTERFSIKNLKEVEGNHVEVSNRFAALEHLDTVMEINSGWKIIIDTITFQPKRE
jgi:hypothetical protein